MTGEGEEQPTEVVPVAGADEPSTAASTGPATEAGTADATTPEAPKKAPTKRPSRAKAAAPDAAGAEAPAAGAPKKAPAKRAGSSASGAARTPAAKRATGTKTGAATPRARSTTRASVPPAKPVRSAAAQQSSDTVRERSTKSGAGGAPVAAGPDATTRVVPLPAEPEPADAPTELLAVGEDVTLPLTHPGDGTTEVLPPAGGRADGPAPDRDATEVLTPVDDATRILPVPPALVESRPGPPAAGGDRSPEEAAPPAPPRTDRGPVLRLAGLTKRFGSTVAVDGIDLSVQPGSFYGIVGPNGAGKTTTLSMVSGLLRPDAGTVHVHGIDVWAEPERAKRAIGVLPDALRLFDRLSGAQLLHYSGVLRGLDAPTVRQRSADLVAAFGLEDAATRLVADYSAGMTKKIALACAMIHSPRVLVLDEPFESVDPVSAANIVDILQRYVHAGGTVVLSSHSMDLIQRICDQVAIVIGGRVLAAGTTDEVRGEQTLEERFVALAGGRKAAEGLEWLHSFAD
jgi:ABC-type multidrug transport system ATPase subunit